MSTKAIALKLIPQICDYDCPAAAFPPAETAGICRTMAAVWCGQLQELVNKNRPCEFRRRAEMAKPARPARRKQADHAPDRETMSLSRSRKFQKIIERSLREYERSGGI